MADMQNAGQAGPDKKGFFSTSTGKVVGILIGLGVLGIVVGIAAAFILNTMDDKTADTLEPSQQVQGESTSTAGATTTPSTPVASKSTVFAATPAAQVPYDQVFTRRDIFKPLIKPASTSAGTGTTGGTTGGTTPADTVTPTADGTLYLDGVVTDNGVLKAQLRYNGASYTLGAGEAIPNSPWAVLRVSSTNVTMLYGDTQVTLAVGQGITK